MTGRRSPFFSRICGCATLAFVACWTVSANAQVEFKDLAGLKSGGSVAPAEFSAKLTPTPGASDEVELTIHAKLPASFYIYSTTGEFAGRTQITTKETGLESIDQEFQADREPKTAFEPLFNMELSKFYDQVTWKRRYRIQKGADLKTVAIQGQLEGQYCSDEAGKCVQIRPAYEFDVKLTRFHYEDRPKLDRKENSLLRFQLSPSDAKPGDKVTLSVEVELKNGWHTYSMIPRDISEPTVIELEGLKGLKPLGTGFRPDRDPVIETPEPGKIQEVFHDHVTWTRDFEVLEDAKPGEYGLQGEIFFQMCKTGCLSLKLKFELGDAAGATAVNAATNRSPVQPEKESPTRSTSPSPKAEGTDGKPAPAVGQLRPQDRGLIPFLMTAIGFGFIALLTPCVWPMVPITVSFFLKQSESEHHRPALTALVFCGSIVATFTILGVGIAALFGAGGLNQLANNPWLNVVIGTVFVVFAFNMLGLFEIRIPSSLLTFTASKEQAGGYIGAMFMALTFTLTSFTCTFAFAGSLLVAASQGQYYWPVIGMLTFGAAFASPFFVLAMVPSLLKKLPKSGGWMNAVKVVMGLVEIGAAVKFFSNADFKWNPSEPLVFDYVFVMITWLVLSLTTAMYLLGVFRLAHDVPSPGISVPRLVLVMVFLGLSGNLAMGLISERPGGGWIMEQIVSFAPPRFDSDTAPSAGREGSGNGKSDYPQPTLSKHGIRHILDVDKAIAYAKEKNQPMLFDFTGVNCQNCRKMELKMTKPHNRSRLEKFVLVQLYTDAVPGISDRMEEARLLKRNQDLQIDWFNDATLPAYAVVTPDGKTILSAFLDGLEMQEGKFAAFMDEGLKKWEGMNQGSD